MSDEGWVDFILSKAGIAIFSIFVFLAVIGIPENFAIKNERIVLENEAKRIAYKIAEVGKSRIPLKNFIHLSDVDVEISPTHVVAKGENIKVAVPLILKVYLDPSWNHTGEEGVESFFPDKSKPLIIEKIKIGEKEYVIIYQE
jgi:hypothetical protein